MNPPPQPPLQPPRSSFSCDRHPDENFTGFCPSCLCERLTTLDQSANAAAAPSSSRRNSTSSSTTAAAAIKAIFNKNKPSVTAGTRNSLPELRRSKSFSAAKNDGLGFSAGVYEPQRKSCDVRTRNTLSSLFSIHDENRPRLSYSQQQTLGSNGVVLEPNREDEEEEEEEEGHEEDQIHKNDDVDEEIKVSEEIRVSVNDLDHNIVEEAVKIEQKEESISISDELKPMAMKDHIDLDSQSKKPSRSNFWSAASVLTKKWQKWRRKQKERVTVTGTNGVILSSTLPVEKPISRQYRETQSEIADYGFGRRSCDTDPRFSLDVGRVSFDDPRYSFDEPRASWDGYLIGRTFPRLPPMVEDAPVVHVPRCDSQIPVENGVVLDENIPGGTVQTREYYLDSSSKRRKSLDRSNSIRRMAASVVAELDETKVNNAVSNTKVSPATIDYNGHGVLIDPPRVSNSNSSLRDDSSETFELGFKDRDNMIPIGGEKKEVKKGRKWRWKLWGFIHRRSKDDDEDRCSTVSGVGRSYSESWQDCNNEVNNGVNRKVFRSNSSVSWRSSSLRRSNPSNMNGKLVGNEQGFVNGKSRRTADEFVFERNRSARYSPNHIDNGLLRFYLGPLSGSRRSGIGISTGKNRATSNTHSIARSMLGLY
ncbi:putative protein OCTOPUS [Helianthus annuus]|nr:putative protein OCTOPUS [Helianthus annuus]